MRVSNLFRHTSFLKKQRGGKLLLTLALRLTCDGCEVAEPAADVRHFYRRVKL